MKRIRGGVLSFLCIAIFLLICHVSVFAQGGDTYLDAVPISIPYGYDFGDTSDSSLTDSLESLRDTKDVWYKIEVPSGESCTVTICLSAPTGDCWDTYLAIWDSDPSLNSYDVVSDDVTPACTSGWYGSTWGDDSDQYCQSSIVDYALSAGTYYICCEGYNWGSYPGEGEYCLEISGTCSTCDCGDATYIDCSSGTISGNNGTAPQGADCWNSYEHAGCTWDESGPESLYLFGNLTGEDQAVRMTLTPQTGIDLDLFLAPYDYCGSDFVGAYDDTELYMFSSNGYGLYTIVDGRNGDQGNYDLAINCETFCDADGFEIHCGQKYTNMTTDLGRPSYWDTYDDDNTDPAEVTWTDGEELIFILDNSDGSIPSFTASLSNHSLDLDVILMFDTCDNDTGFVAWGEESVTVSSASTGRYFIIVDSYSGQECSFDLEVTCNQQLLDCSGSTTLTCNNTITGDTTGGNTDVSYYNCDPWEENGPERVYRFTLSAAEDITLILSPDDVEAYDLDLFLLSSCDEESCLADSATNYSVETIQEHLDSGTYYVVVDGYRGEYGPYSLTYYCGATPTPTPTVTPTPTITPTPTVTRTQTPIPTPTPIPEFPLDCSAAISLNCGQYFFGSTNNGTANAINYNCAPGHEEFGKEMVFQLDVTVPYTMTAHLWPTLSIDLDLFLLSGCSQNSCIDASVTSSGEETITHYLNVGTYYLVVDGPREADFTLYYDCPPETLDCSNVVPITCGGDAYSGTTDGADLNVTQYGCSGAESLEESGPEVVHTITVSPGPLTLTLTPATGVDLDLFLLNSCDQDDCVAYSSDGQGVQEVISITVPSTTTYYVVVDGYRGAMGGYTLNAECGSAPTPTPTSTSPATITPTPTPHPPTHTPTPPLTPLPTTGPVGLGILFIVMSWILIVSLSCMGNKKKSGSKER